MKSYVLSKLTNFVCLFTVLSQLMSFKLREIAVMASTGKKCNYSEAFLDYRFVNFPDKE